MFVQKRTTPIKRTLFTLIALLVTVANAKPACWKAFIPDTAYAQNSLAAKQTMVFPLASNSLVKIKGDGEDLEAAENADEISTVSAAPVVEAVVCTEDKLLGSITEITPDINKDAITAVDISENKVEMSLSDVRPEDVKIQDQYIAKYVNNPKMAIQLSEYELHLLEELVYGEAGNQDMIGQILIANVVINRVNSKYFPNTVYEVIDQPGSFSRISTGRFDGNRATETTKEAVRRALSGEDYSNGANSYMNPVYCSQWAIDWFNTNLIFMFIHQDHYFYRTPRA